MQIVLYKSEKDENKKKVLKKLRNDIQKDKKRQEELEMKNKT